MTDAIAKQIAKTWAERLPVLKLTNEMTALGVVLNRFDVEAAAPYLEPIAAASPEISPPLHFFEQIFQHYQKRLQKDPGILYNVDIARQAFILKAFKH